MLKNGMDKYLVRAGYTKDKGSLQLEWYECTLDKLIASSSAAILFQFRHGPQLSFFLIKSAEVNELTLTSDRMICEHKNADNSPIPESTFRSLEP